jgi:hypothetical protein
MFNYVKYQVLILLHIVIVNMQYFMFLIEYFIIYNDLIVLNIHLNGLLILYFHVEVIMILFRVILFFIFENL